MSKEAWEIAADNLKTHKSIDTYDHGAGYSILHCTDCRASGADWDRESDIQSFTCEAYKSRGGKS